MPLGASGRPSCYGCCFEKDPIVDMLVSVPASLWTTHKKTLTVSDESVDMYRCQHTRSLTIHHQRHQMPAVAASTAGVRMGYPVEAASPCQAAQSRPVAVAARAALLCHIMGSTVQPSSSQAGSSRQHTGRSWIIFCSSTEGNLTQYIPVQ